MVIRKITVDNSVRYIPIIEKPKERDIKPKTVKAGLLKQNKKLSKIIKNGLLVDLVFLNE